MSDALWFWLILVGYIGLGLFVLGCFYAVFCLGVRVLRSIFDF